MQLIESYPQRMRNHVKGL